MIINIRGSNGAGKSTLVRRVMDQFEVRSPAIAPGRKQPLFYELWLTKEGQAAGNKPDLIVLGHYESVCGGCDTIHSMDETYNLVKAQQTHAKHVIFEGILISLTFGRNLELHQLYGHSGFMAITLDRTAQQCVDDVNARRSLKGKDIGNPAGVIAKHDSVQRTLLRMDEQGMNSILASRERAFELIMEQYLL